MGVIVKYIVLIFLVLSYVNIHAQTFSEYYKNAVIAEKNADFQRAYEQYKLALDVAKGTQIKEQMQLAVARMAILPTDKIEHYLKFLSAYPQSRFQMLARYELGMLYYLLGEADSSLAVFEEIAKLGYGTPYYHKSLLIQSQILIDKKEYDEALLAAYHVLEEIEEYVEAAQAYYLVGIIFIEKGMDDTALEYLLMCAGNFTNSYFGKLALFSLTELYIRKNDAKQAELYAGLIASKFPNSQEFKDVKLRFPSLKKRSMEDVQESLILLGIDEEKRSSLLAQIREELISSLRIEDIDGTKETMIKAGTYLQLGSFSVKKNAEDAINTLLKKGATNLRVHQTIGNENYLYKIIAGPFSSQSLANNEVIRLKDLGIDSFVTEIATNYE